MKLRVNIFNTSSNLPLFAAVANGFFAKRGLEIEIQNTPNSDEQRAGLAEGKFEIAHAAVDNAVAMADLEVKRQQTQGNDFLQWRLRFGDSLCSCG